MHPKELLWISISCFSFIRDRSIHSLFILGEGHSAEYTTKFKYKELVRDSQLSTELYTEPISDPLPVLYIWVVPSLTL